MFCSNCGVQLNDSANFCPKCGTGVVKIQTPPAQPVIQQQVYNQLPNNQQTVNMPKISAWDYFVLAMKKYAVFKGRARRSEFWYFTLFSFIFVLVVSIIDVLLPSELMVAENYGLLSTLTRVFLFVPGLSVLVRRMHDCDKAGYYFLIPVYGWFVLPCTAGTVGANQYGDDPKQILDDGQSVQNNDIDKIRIPKLLIVTLSLITLIIIWSLILPVPYYNNIRKYWDIAYIYPPYHYTALREEIEIINYFGSKKDVQIPSQIRNKPVKSICNSAFTNNKELTSVIIPDSVEKIDSFAFKKESPAFGNSPISTLTNITIGANVRLGWEGSMLAARRDDPYEEARANSNIHSFPSLFDVVYVRNGRRAGTYTYKNRIWHYEE